MKNIKGYKDALEILYGDYAMFSKTGVKAYKPGPGNSLRLCEIYGNPHKKFKSIHVGGTNGKGSTSHMIASVLQSEGYKVGLFTSPHLVDFRERIKINGEMIPEEKVVEFMRDMDLDFTPSFFEITMTMAFSWFAEQEIDYAVVEVGLGGRLDSTNIITPLISVITNISLDHTSLLGNKLEEIAREKAGIIKPGVPVVIGERQEEVSGVFIEKAREEGSEIIFAEDKAFTERDGIYIDSKLGGDYQKKNLKTAVAALDTLQKKGLKISDSSIRAGIANVVNLTGLMGRWMQLSETPLIIADVGHNPAGMEWNMSQLKRLMEKRESGTLRIVIGFMADKAVEEIVTILPGNARYYVSNVAVSRAMPGEELLRILNKSGLEGRVFRDFKEALETVKEETDEKDVIFIGGSFSVVGEVIEKFKDKKSDAR